MEPHRAPEPGEAEAAKWLAVLRRYLDGDATLTRAAAEAGVLLRTARRWLARYRNNGPTGPARPRRADSGARKIASGLVELIEGLALTKPRLSAATIHRRVDAVAHRQRWRAPSYSSVHAIMAALDPAMMTLAHEGRAVFRDRYELVHRHRAERPNAIWQSDHTELDILIFDAGGKEARLWLTTVIDDFSRVVAGYMVFLGATSALNTSLALRKAIWRKARPDWHVCGIPDILYVDHGSDFTSLHLEQAAADLRFQLIYSAVARPQGRGKIERLFRTINTELLPELPGNLRNGKPASPPQLSLPELDAAIGAFITSRYNARVHGEIDATPVDAWRGDGWLPRMNPGQRSTEINLLDQGRRRHRVWLTSLGIIRSRRRSPVSNTKARSNRKMALPSVTRRVCPAAGPCGRRERRRRPVHRDLSGRRPRSERRP